MEKSELIHEVLVAIAMLTGMNYIIFRDSILVSFICAIALTAFFWIGRLSVRFYRRRKQVTSLTDE